MAEKDNQFQGVVESLLKGMDTVLSTKTVVGQDRRYHYITVSRCYFRCRSRCGE